MSKKPEPILVKKNPFKKYYSGKEINHYNDSILTNHGFIMLRFHQM